MKLELPTWAVAAGGLLLGFCLIAVPYLWMERGEREAEAERWRDSSRTASATADSVGETVKEVRDSLQQVQDSLQDVTLELSKTQMLLTGAMAADIDTLKVALPDSLQHIPRRLQARLDSLRRSHQEERRVWKQRLATKQQELEALEKLWRAEHKARLAGDRAREELNDALNPPVWTHLAEGIPEAGAKIGGGLIACSGELPTEACVTYIGALGIDFIFDL